MSDLNFRFDGTTASSDPLSTTVGVNHSWIGDLKFALTSPAGTSVIIFDRPGFPALGAGCNGNNLHNLTLDDDGGLPPIENQCPAGDNEGPLTGSFSPNNPLSAFDGQTANGNWTLKVSDEAAQDTGAVRAFSLIFTTVFVSPTPTPTRTPTPTPTPTPSPTPTPTPGSSRVEGDVVDANGGPNGDGLVLSNDVSVIRRFVLGTLVPVNQSQFERADINGVCGDGSINSADVTVIRQFLLGNLVPSPTCNLARPLSTSWLIEIGYKRDRGRFFEP